MRRAFKFYVDSFPVLCFYVETLTRITLCSERTTPRGTSLADAIESTDLVLLNDGSPTFFGHRGKPSVLDLSFASPDLDVYWSLDVDTRGSDHLPVLMSIPRVGRLPRRLYHVTNWDLFRKSLLSLDPSEDILKAIPSFLVQSTTKITLRVSQPSPDLKFLRAARRRAQRRALRSGKIADWVECRRITSALRRHTRVLRRRQFRQFCSSLTPCTPKPKIYKVLRGMSGSPTPRDVFVALSLKTGLALCQLADEFAIRFVVAPRSVRSSRPLSLTGPSRSPQNLDHPLTMSELEAAFRRCKRHSAPGPDHITYQALRNLSYQSRSSLLERLNSVWSSGVIPQEWKHALITPLLKRGKPSSELSSYRPISLTSCVGKLLERLVLTRLQWFLDDTEALPPELAGFRSERCTADCIATLTSALEDARSQGHTGLAVFLDVERAFDSVPHDVVLACLRHLGVTGRMLRYFEDFLNGRTISVRLGTFQGAVRPLLRGLPQGSCLSPTLFNVVMATLPLCMDSSPHPSGMIIYADDICLWASHSDRRILRPFMQTCLKRVANMLEDLGLSISAEKTAVLACSSRPLRHGFPRLTLSGIRLPRVRNYRYLGVDLNSRLCWRRHVTTLVGQSTMTTSLIRRLRGLDWGPTTRALTHVHRALNLSRILYVAPYLPPTRSLWDQLERRHRAGLRMALGLPSYSRIEATWIEAQEMPVSSHAKERALRHLVRLAQSSSGGSLYEDIQRRHCSHYGRHCNTLIEALGSTPAVQRSPADSPWSEHPFTVYDDIPDFHGKSQHSSLVSRALTEDVLASRHASFKGQLRFFSSSAKLYSSLCYHLQNPHGKYYDGIPPRSSLKSLSKFDKHESAGFG